jgi:hypothetical protein
MMFSSVGAGNEDEVEDEVNPTLEPLDSVKSCCKDCCSAYDPGNAHGPPRLTHALVFVATCVLFGLVSTVSMQRSI